MDECCLTNDKGETIAMGSRDQMLRYAKHHVPDGMYQIVGPAIDMQLYRDDGIVYPCSGTMDGQRLKPLSLEESKTFYGAKE